VLVWLSVWSEVQTCIWPSGCHCHSLSLASVKSRLVLPFWYQLTRVVSEQRAVKRVCVCVCVCVCYTFFPELTYRSDPATDFHAWWLERCVLTQGCAFWGFHWYYSPFWGWNPLKHQFRGVNKRFQAKRAKYWKLHIIETTALTSTTFCIMTETIKWSSWVVPIGTQQSKMADGRYFEKKRYITISLQPFDWFWWN